MADSLPGVISRRFSLGQKALALLPVLLLLVYLPGESQLRCRMDGLVRSACCCPERHEPASSVPVAKAQDCCDREVTVNKRVPADTVRNGGLDIASLALAVAPSNASFSTFAADPQPPIVRSHGPPRDGPSVVLLKHAFLI